MIEIIVFFIAVIVDQLSKAWALYQLKPIGTYELLPGVLHLTYAENTGAAFSMLAGNTVILTVFPLIICTILIYVLISKKITSRIGNWSLVLVLSGAVGNLIDRIFRGAVIDFFEIRLFKFAIFNVADVFITVGAVLLFVYILFLADKKDSAS